MGDLARMVGEGIAQTVRIRGEDYHLSPLTFRGWAELEGWIENGWRTKSLAALGELATSEERVQVTIGLAEKDADLSHVMQLIQSAHGLGRVLWMSLRAKHPEMSVEEATNLLDIKNFAELQTILKTALGMDVKEDTPGPPARKRSARGPR